MTIQSEFSMSAALLVTLATITSLVIAFRCTTDRLTATVSGFTSPIEEAEFWVRALGG